MYSTWCWMNYEVFTFSALEYGPISALCEFQGLSPLYLLSSFIPFLGRFTHTHRLISTQTQGGPCADLWCSPLFVPLSSLVSCPVSSGYFGFPSLHLLIHTRLLGFTWTHSPCAAWKLCEGSKLGQSKGSLVCFLSLGGHFSMLLNVQCSKTIVLHFCIVLNLFFRWKGKYGACYLLIMAALEVVE